MGSNSSRPDRQDKYWDEIKQVKLKFHNDDETASRDHHHSSNTASDGNGATDYTWLWWTLGVVGILGLASIIGCVLCSYFANKRAAREGEVPGSWIPWPRAQGRRFSQSLLYYVPPLRHRPTGTARHSAEPERPTLADPDANPDSEQ